MFICNQSKVNGRILPCNTTNQLFLSLFFPSPSVFMEGISIQHMTLFSVFFATVMSHAVQTILYTVPTELSSPLLSYLSYTIYTQETAYSSQIFPLGSIDSHTLTDKMFSSKCVKTLDKPQIKEKPLRCVLWVTILYLRQHFGEFTQNIKIKHLIINRLSKYNQVVFTGCGLLAWFCGVFSVIPCALQKHSWSQKG